LHSNSPGVFVSEWALGRQERYSCLVLLALAWCINANKEQQGAKDFPSDTATFYCEVNRGGKPLSAAAGNTRTRFFFTPAGVEELTTIIRQHLHK